MNVDELLSRQVAHRHSVLALIICCLALAITATGFIADGYAKYNPPISTPEIVSSPIDEIARKQKEMRDTIVLVGTMMGSGSGTIIRVHESDQPDVYEYLILTNAHVTVHRFANVLSGVDSLRGLIKTREIDLGCIVTIFDEETDTSEVVSATVLDEDFIMDVSILSFQYNKLLPVARIADDRQLKQVRVFDEVFAIGCQLGQKPLPTNGIIARIINDEVIVYMNTADISPGSSGGGLFKEYESHYYLIGIPFSASVAPNGQFLPHMAHAISILSARTILDRNLK